MGRQAEEPIPSLWIGMASQGECRRLLWSCALEPENTQPALIGNPDHFLIAIGLRTSIRIGF